MRCSVRLPGSSPRMRGARTIPMAARAPPGIIPAYAGSTCRTRAHRRQRMDHPRVCGEHPVPQRLRRVDDGSSPRMRGAPRNISPRRRRRGIIPAYAGSTNPHLCSRDVWRDHPRVCGEHYYESPKETGREGSSPRMRGAPRDAPVASDAVGIIPAYAGSTLGFTFELKPTGDHPRVCGEHWGTTDNDSRITGSSPRMRGVPVQQLDARRGDGIIPAYAGSTHRLAGAVGRAGDHPRVCGEHPKCPWRVKRALGSSPRMRGALVVTTVGTHNAGIIPAYAGSTARENRRPRFVRDHPRVCGEHSIA